MTGWLAILSCIGPVLRLYPLILNPSPVTHHHRQLCHVYKRTFVILFILEATISFSTLTFLVIQSSRDVDGSIWLVYLQVSIIMSSTVREVSG